MKNLNTYRLFIGANNTTKKVEKKIIAKVALNYFPSGYTIYNSQGAWRGGEEPSVIMELITDNKNKVLELTKELKKMLNQDAILLQEIQATSNFI